MDAKTNGLPSSSPDDLFLLETEAQVRRTRRIRMASYFELFLVITIALILIFQNVIGRFGPVPIHEILPRLMLSDWFHVIGVALTATDVLITSAYLILAIFSLLLNGVTPAAAFLNIIGTAPRVKLTGAASVGPHAPPITVASTSIEKHFDEYLARSRAAAARAQARPNA